MPTPQTSPVITGLQNMVAAQSSQKLWASFDDMVPFDRTNVAGSIHTAKAYDTAVNDEYELRLFKDRMTPTFYDLILANIKTERATRLAQIEAAEAALRMRNNATWDNLQAGNSWRLSQQPTDSWGANIGTRAYKWLRNYKATNGDWYAEYQPVRGGTNRKHYSLSLNRWSDDYPMRVRCPSCNHPFEGMSPLIRNACPSCGNTQNLQYGGRL